MFAPLGFLLAYRINNRLRGTNFIEDLERTGKKVTIWHKILDYMFDKTGCAVVFGVLAGLYVNEMYEPKIWVSAAVAGIVGAGLRLWSGPGWGKYFSAAHGQYNPAEEEIAWIDWIGAKLIKKTDFKSNRIRGMICMAIRGWAYAQPMFVALGALTYYITHSSLAGVYVGLIGLAMLVQGFWYWLSYYLPTDAGIKNAEENTGTWIAALLLLVFSIMFS